MIIVIFFVRSLNGFDYWKMKREINCHTIFGQSSRLVIASFGTHLRIFHMTTWNFTTQFTESKRNSKMQRTKRVSASLHFYCSGSFWRIATEAIRPWTLIYVTSLSFHFNTLNFTFSVVINLSAVQKNKKHFFLLQTFLLLFFLNFKQFHVHRTLQQLFFNEQENF